VFPKGGNSLDATKFQTSETNIAEKTQQKKIAQFADKKTHWRAFSAVNI
jgi:hypothetical protein